MSADNCPACGVSLVGAPIPQPLLDDHCYADGITHYSRRIGVEIRGVYDGTLYYLCPDCTAMWHRWPEGHPLRDKAAAHMALGTSEGAR